MRLSICRATIFLASFWSVFASAQSDGAEQNIFLMTEVLLAAIVCLVVLAIFLHRSRAKHPQAEAELEQARKELPFLVVQRPRRLNEFNQALQNEIRLQEHTSRSLQSANDLLDSILTCMPSMLVAVTPDGAGGLIIGKEENNVRLIGHHNSRRLRGPRC